jgi:hypothetical protein
MLFAISPYTGHIDDVLHRMRLFLASATIKPSGSYAEIGFPRSYPGLKRRHKPSMLLEDMPEGSKKIYWVRKVGVMMFVRSILHIPQVYFICRSRRA